MEASLCPCVLTAFLATGACLQCEVCSGPGTSCTGALQTCAAGKDSCGIFLAEVLLEGMKIPNIFQGCATSSQCKTGPVTMNFGNGMTTRTSVACCVGDACRPALISVPPPVTKPNGRSCRACYSLFSEQCHEETITCTGAETHCIDAAGIMMIGGRLVQAITKGCTSESICAQLQVGPGTFAGISANLTTTKCTVASGATGVPPATTTPGATGTAPATTTSRTAPATTTSRTAPATTTSSMAGAAPGPAGLLLPALTGLLLLKLLS